jgi:hypothetical protein
MTTNPSAPIGVGGFLNFKLMTIFLAILIYLMGCFIAYRLLTQQIIFTLSKFQRNFVVFLGTALSWVTILTFLIDFYINTND